MSSSLSSPLAHDEPSLTLQAFHQCASFVSVRLTSTNFLLWRSQILPLVKSLGVLHHIKDAEKPPMKIENSEGEQVLNPNLELWNNNDNFLTAWIRGTITEEVLNILVGAETAYQVWVSLEEQMLPATKEREGQLKNMLLMLKKGSLDMDEYLRKFKQICDNLAAINQPMSDLDKVFQLARGLGTKYQNFRLAMLTKPPYPTFNQFVLALQGHEQSVLAEKEEQKQYVEHAQAYLGQRGRGRTGRGARNFNSRGRGFLPSIGRDNNQGQSNSNTSNTGYME